VTSTQELWVRQQYKIKLQCSCQVTHSPYESFTLV